MDVLNTHFIQTRGSLASLGPTRCLVEDFCVLAVWKCGCVFSCEGVRVCVLAVWECRCVFGCMGVRVCFGCVGVRVCFWLYGSAGVFLLCGCGCNKLAYLGFIFHRKSTYSLISLQISQISIPILKFPSNPFRLFPLIF